jgi:hypothetical protein
MSEETGIARSTMASFYKKWQRTKKISSLKIPGRPCLLKERQVKAIVSLVRNYPKSTVFDIKTKLGLNCHRMTISEALRKEGFSKYKMLRKPKLTEQHRASRINFARNNKRTNWDKVLFSDESSIELYKSYHEKVWRKPGLASLPKYLKCEKTVFIKKYIKIWSCFSSKGTGKLVFLEDYGKWSGKTYEKILNDHLKAEGIRLCGRDFVFQDDGDTVHTCNRVSKWKKDNKIVSLKNWPPCSGDLSPLENLWWLLKRELSKRPFVNLSRFKQNIEEIWAGISPSICSRLVESIPRRLAKVLENDGYPTKY